MKCWTAYTQRESVGMPGMTGGKDLQGQGGGDAHLPTKEEKDMTDSLRKQWNDTCKACGLKPISLDTAARIMAVVYAFDREEITHCEKLKTDIEYIQYVYNIGAGLTPNQEFIVKFQKYALCVENDDRGVPCEWVKKLMRENYNINL